MDEQNERDRKNIDDTMMPGKNAVTGFTGRGFIMLVFIVLLILIIKSMFL